MYGIEKECTESSYGAVESAKLLLEPFQTTEYDGEKNFLHFTQILGCFTASGIEASRC